MIVGNASNLEETSVVMGGTGMFTAILRLQHNQGEPVNAWRRFLANLEPVRDGL